MVCLTLGSKSDTSRSDGKTIRYYSDLATDFAVTVGEMKFYLHKFPLISKSSHMQKLIAKADEEQRDEIELADFPGGYIAFDICVKFCYGIIVTLCPCDVAAARRAAEYLEMTENVDQHNLIYEIEVFLNSKIFHTWEDTIMVLKKAVTLLPWSEDLKIVGRCIDSIASKTSINPTEVTWYYCKHNRNLAMQDRINKHETIESVPKDWWVEDICELDSNMYKRVMVAIKSKGRMDGSVIKKALKTYANKWLPTATNALISDNIQRNKSSVETIICLLPSDKSMGCSCSFLFKLLSVAVLVHADVSAREELVRKISMRLDQASVKDLLIPPRPHQTTIYDVELVLYVVKRYQKSCWELNLYKEDEIGETMLGLGRGSWSTVGVLTDAYLAEIASDPNLTPSSFIELSRLIPESARPIHDELYKAINMYLKEHPDLSKAEKKQMCGLMDVKKLTMDASIDAAQNDRLPLRVVVQVLYFEQMRSATTAETLNRTCRNTSSSTPNGEEEEWGQRSLQSCKSVREQMEKVKIEDNKEHQQNEKMVTKKNSHKNSRTRMFHKLWGINWGTARARAQRQAGALCCRLLLHCFCGDTNSSGSSSRHGRHAIS